MSKNYRVHLDLEVYDERALFNTALKHARSTGSSHTEAMELLMPDGQTIDVSACLIMLLDPGESPSGLTILESSVE
jgi:hypothetical protein